MVEVKDETRWDIELAHFFYPLRYVFLEGVSLFYDKIKHKNTFFSLLAWGFLNAINSSIDNISAFSKK